MAGLFTPHYAKKYYIQYKYAAFNLLYQGSTNFQFTPVSDFNTKSYPLSFYGQFYA